ncbi:ATP synthase subunits region ORF 7-like [Littorina saxatilis]|uniref:ATP synthase subunits region ORF 7-like n=1 Tax=Littorina saxatilis TaxID=31220 RepID=UPI0038B6A4F9
MSSLKTSLAAKRCESGSEGFEPHNQSTVTDINGGITRTHTKHVTFSPPFPSIPKVTAGITYIDAEHTTNTRIHTDVINLQASGFDLKVQEWLDSYNYGVNLMWMACSN